MTLPSQPDGSPSDAERRILDATAQNAARHILDSIAAHFVPDQEYVQVKEDDYRHLDLGFYRRTTEALEARQFLRLPDVENRTLAQAMGNVLQPVFIRPFLSPEGTTTVGIYHPRLKSWVLRVLLWLFRAAPGRTIDLETEFLDGSFVTTSNGMAAARLQPPPLIDALFLPYATPLQELLERHEERVQTHQRQSPRAVVRPVRSFEEMIASQHRSERLKAAWRGEVGGVTREELERLSLFGKGAAHEVHDQIVQMRGPAGVAQPPESPR
jgi:hypothetical protein